MDREKTVRNKGGTGQRGRRWIKAARWLLCLSLVVLCIAGVEQSAKAATGSRPLAGNWQFNSTISLPNYLNSNKSIDNIDMPFTVVSPTDQIHGYEGVTGLSMQWTSFNNHQYGTLYFVSSNNNSFYPVYAHDVTVNQWNTSLFSSAPEVDFGMMYWYASDGLYSWFTSNARRVLVTTIFSANGGSWDSAATNLSGSINRYQNRQIAEHVGAAYDYYGGFPSEPTRVGYHFTGWYTAPTGGTQVSQFSEVPDYDHKLYAHWEPNVVNIAYVIDGGTVTSSQYSVYVKTDTIMTNYLTVNTTVIQKLTYGTSGDPYNATTFGLTKEGYVFAGWIVKSTGQRLDQDTVYDATVYAQYDDPSITVANRNLVACKLIADWCDHRDKTVRVLNSTYTSGTLRVNRTTFTPIYSDHRRENGAQGDRLAYRGCFACLCRTLVAHT